MYWLCKFGRHSFRAVWDESGMTGYDQCVNCGHRVAFSCWRCG
jgi:hypothetical protein